MSKASLLTLITSILFFIGCASHPVVHPGSLKKGERVWGYSIAAENIFPVIWFRRGLDKNTELGYRLGMPIYGTGIDISRVVLRQEKKWDVMNFAWNSPNVLAYVDASQIGVAATSSDYRIKKNIKLQTATGIDRVKLLKPSTFEYDNYKSIWAADGITREGFIAHEVQEVIPTGATGTKDGDEIQALQTDAILSVVTKALQEAITKIETLETEVAALKAA